MTSERLTPTRRSTASPDVVVIGGGIVGVACAAHLAAAGRRVVLVERDRLAAGASGRNSGVVQHPFDPVLADLHLETVELYRAVSDAVGGTFHLPPRPAGLLSVTTDPDTARREAEQLAVAHPELHPTYLAPGEVTQLEPAIDPAVAACRLETGYPVAPAFATHAYAAWARSLGVHIREGVGGWPVLEGDRVTGVRLDDGMSLAAADVVVAAGPWSPALIDPTGIWQPIRPLWGVVVAIDLAAPPAHVLEEAVSDIPADDDGAGSDDHSFSLVTADGASSLGSTFLAEEPDAASFVRALRDRGSRFVPAVETAPLGAVRACARPLSRDGRPLVGRVPWIDGVWIAAGHGPWGISTGPASGRLLADLLDGTVAGSPPALDPARFGATP